MLGKIIGAAAGAAAGNATRGMSGTTGAIIGTLAVAAARRMGVLGLIAATAGGYALKKVADKREQAAKREEAERERPVPAEPIKQGHVNGMQTAPV